VVERAVYRADALIVSDIVFDPFYSPFQPDAAEPQNEALESEPRPATIPEVIDRPLKDAVWELKVQMLENALKKTEYNQKKAAKRLGLTYHQFRGLYRQYQNKKTPSSEQ
jgi:psp operon transcriptional activator